MAPTTRVRICQSSRNVGAKDGPSQRARPVPRAPLRRSEPAPETRAARSHCRSADQDPRDRGWLCATRSPTRPSSLRAQRSSAAPYRSFMLVTIVGSASASAPVSLLEQQIDAVDPFDPAKAGDQMTALDDHPINPKIGKAGIERARRVTRGETRQKPRIGHGFGPTRSGSAAARRAGRHDHPCRRAATIPAGRKQCCGRAERDPTAAVSGSRRDRRRAGPARRRARRAGWWRVPRVRSCASAGDRAGRDRGSILDRPCRQISGSGAPSSSERAIKSGHSRQIQRRTIRKLRLWAGRDGKWPYLIALAFVCRPLRRAEDYWGTTSGKHDCSCR